jgi:sarcosine oxidase, subunit alpha
MPRLRPPRDPVPIHLDGQVVEAERGEPAAVALIAAGRLALARSPKFHRPRGPTCLRAACDGCLARVDGVPNVMTCRVPAVEGLRIETQNVVGSRDTDLLRVADWFFPEGMNHHELLAGIPGVQRVFQGIARRVAGLGKLPEGTAAPREASRREADALVVGSGPAGMAAAIALAGRGRAVEVVDDDLEWGGDARILRGAGVDTWTGLLRAFGEAVAAGRVGLSLGTTAAGIYGDDVLVVREAASESRVEVVRARTLVLAPGAHDGALAFEGNDVPGVLSARAGCRLLAHGVVPGVKVVIVRAGGGSAFGRAYASADSAAEVVEGVPVQVTGNTGPKGVTVATAEGKRRVPCDAVLLDAPPSPSYELCGQAGGQLSHEGRGYVVGTSACGRLRAGVFTLGGVTGRRADPTVLAGDARRMAEDAES